MGINQRRGITTLLSTVALLSTTWTAQAATFTPNNAAELATAITDANGNAVDDIIDLDAATTYTLTSALPAITSTITINGNGTAIERDATGGTPEFRILEVTDTGNLTLNEIKLSNGNVGVAAGGAILNNGVVSANDTHITGNTASSGGGIYNTMGTITLRRSTVSYNHATSSNGAGIYNNTGATVSVEQSSFFNNSADSAVSKGGALYNAGTAVLASTTFHQNSAADRGGFLYNSKGTTAMTNCTVSQNVATKDAAGIRMFSGTTTITNSLFADNTLSDGTTLSTCVGVLTSAGHNLIDDTTGCTVTAATGDLFDDPNSPTDLGTFTDDTVVGAGHLPLRGSSAALNRGDDTACVDTSGSGGPNLLIDQLGQGRVGTCDIGAVEAICSDAITQAANGEQCDDGNLIDGDACSADCRNEICGDGQVVAVEACDDQNAVGADGCSATCTIENGYSCTGEPSVCTTSCGDGIIAGTEECDGTNLGGATCTDRGFDTGTLVCSVSCAFDTSACEITPVPSSNPPTTAGGGCSLIR